jgi:hypothetical protein
MSEPVPAVQASGLARAEAVVWTWRGSAALSVAVKTSYTLTAGGISPSAPEPFDPNDQPYAGSTSLRTAAESVLRLGRAELLHAGAVVAPAGVTMVRLAASRAQKVFVDKRAMAKKSDPSPGLGPAARSLAPRPAAAGGIVALPDGFDFARDQAAPPDQQCADLVAGDQVLLANLHPDAAQVVFSIPAAPAARAVADGHVAPLTLACRRLVADTDARRLTLLWLAELPLRSLDIVPRLCVEVLGPAAQGSAQAPGPAPSPARPAPPPAPARAPSALELLRGAARAPAPAPVAAGGGAPGTMLIEEPAPPAASPPGTMVIDSPAPAATATPFGAVSPRAGSAGARSDATPWGESSLLARPLAPIGAGTLAVDLDERSGLLATPALAVATPPPAPTPPAMPPPESPPPFPMASPPAPPAPAADPWAKPEELDPWAQPEPAPTPAAPPPPKPAPRANALKMLYKRGK